MGGMPIVSSYGMLSNEELLRKYGFVIPDNEEAQDISFTLIANSNDPLTKIKAPLLKPTGVVFAELN